MNLHETITRGFSLLLGLTAPVIVGGRRGGRNEWRADRKNYAQPR